MKNTTDLTVTNEVGKALVERARNERQSRMQDLCVGEVDTVLGLIDITKERLKAEQFRLDIYTRRLAAIEEGAINIIAGGSGTVVIQYHEKEISAATLGW